MKTAIATIVLALMLAMSVPVNAEPNEEQSGESFDCLDYLVFYEIPGVESPNAAVVEVDGSSQYKIDSVDGDVYIDFFNSAGESVGFGHSSDDGPTPHQATYGIICVFVAGALPVGPAAWTYQDGL